MRDPVSRCREKACWREVVTDLKICDRHLLLETVKRIRPAKDLSGWITPPKGGLNSDA